jgi:hypothetical protein
MTVKDKNGLFTLAWLVFGLLMLGPVDAAWAQQIKVTSAEPPTALQGTVALDVAIGGSGFDNGSTVRFLVTGTEDDDEIEVTSVSYVSPKKLVARINVAAGATPGQFDIEVKTSTDRKGKGTTLFSVLAKTTDPCVGATAAFVFGKPTSPNAPTRTLYLANDSATCLRALYSTNYGPRHWSFRVVDGSAGTQEGRVVTTDGVNELLLIRFPIGPNMAVDPASISVRRIFDPAQPGYVDATSFDLAADGRRLAYVTFEENGDTSSATRLYRLRLIDDVDACATSAESYGCAYGAGAQLADRYGLYYRISAPRWGINEDWIYLEDFRGDGMRPYVSRVSPAAPLQPGENPQVVYVGGQLTLFELRARGSDEIMLIADNDGSGCRDVRVLKTATCSAGNCPDQVNATSPPVYVSQGLTLESIDATQMRVLADGATEDRRGRCSSTGNIVRAVDSSVTGVQVTTVVTGGDSPTAK